VAFTAPACAHIGPAMSQYFTSLDLTHTTGALGHSVPLPLPIKATNATHDLLGVALDLPAAQIAARWSVNISSGSFVEGDSGRATACALPIFAVERGPCSIWPLTIFITTVQLKARLSGLVRK
jgi:hypothetical protein